MILAGIASIPGRIVQLTRTIESLLPQVDKIHLSLNKYYIIPEIIQHPKVEAVLTQGSDEQKFRKLEGEIFLSCDDDLIYPTNYVEVIKQALNEYDIVTFHGRNFFSKYPILSYYRDKSSRYRCLDKVATDIPVQFGGTGCMAFKPEKIKISLDDFPSKYMADIHFAKLAKEQGKQIVCLAHEAGWIGYQEVGSTIYDRFKNEDYEQTERANQVLRQTVKETI